MQYGAGWSEWLTCRCANASLTDNVEREGEKIKGKSRRLCSEIWGVWGSRLLRATHIT